MISTLRILLAALTTLFALPSLAAFTDNGDGTVTDTVTGLMWDKCSWGQALTSNTCSDSSTATVHNWNAALGIAVTANGNNPTPHRGYTDQRLPNRTELESLVKIDAHSPAIVTTAFPATPSNWFWTSTTYAPSTADALNVLFGNGLTDASIKANTFHVRLVRSGQYFAPFDAGVTHVLPVTKIGAGTVTSSPAGIDCQATCTANFTGRVSVTLSATAATGRTFAGWSGAGCSGTGTCVVTMDAAKDVTATFSVAATDGVCGSAAGQSFIVKPTANLCSTGTSGTVNSANGQYSWTCNGTGGGNSPSCTANWANNAGAGTGSIVNNGSNDWVVTSASFSTTSPATPPAGTSFPNGILSLNLTTTGAAGSDATVVVYYNTPVPAGAVYWKYGRTQSDPTDHWYQLPADRAKFASDRLSVTLRLTDGGIGDHDLVAGSITDPGGPGMPSGGSVTSVPTLSEWGMIVMSLLLAGMTALRLRRE